MRRLIFIIGIACATLSASAQAINTFGDLRAKMLHIGQRLTGQNTANDQAIAVIVCELATNYQGRLSRQQFLELKDTIEGMRQQVTEAKWKTVMNSAIEKLQEKTDTIDIVQRILDYYKKVPQEQIYLHTDRPYYAAGDTVWFRAHLVDAVTHTPISRSRFVYVELHDQQADSLLQRIIVKCDSDGIFSNAIILPRSMHGGNYTLAAYTQWMCNFPAERFCYKPLWVVGGTHVARPLTTSRQTTGVSNPIHIAQRKKQLLVQFCKATDAPLTCVLYGSGNLIVTDYTPGKVLRIDCMSLRPGSISIAFINRQTGTVMAESQTDIEERQPNIAITGRAAINNQPMELNIDISNASGVPLTGTFSLSVADYDAVKPDSSQSTIEHDLSQHRGIYALSDILSGTFPRIAFGFQTKQFITGRVKGSLGQRIKNPHLWVVNNMTGHREEFQLGDSTRFAVAVDNPEGTLFTLEGTRRSGKTSFVELMIDSLSYPQVALPDYALTDAPDFSAFQTQAHLQQMYNLESYIKLPDIEKIGKKRKPLKSNLMGIEAPRGFQEGDPRIERAATMQQLLTALGMRIVSDGNGEQHITTPDNAGVVVYIDNLAEFDDEHGYILSLQPTDIRSIEYFTPNHPINGFYGARPSTWSGKVPAILFIFMKDGSEIVKARAKERPSMATVRLLGYRRPVAFYSPQYDTQADHRPDHRTTLYWNPKVATDSNGHATVRFYASDVSKRYLVTLEGVGNDGTIIHQQLVIE